MKNFFKAFICVVVGVVIMLTAVACNNNQSGENPLPNDYTRPFEVNIDNSFTATSNILVAYFSKTNTTKGVAETVQQLTGADIFEIERKETYPDEYTPTTEEAQAEKEANARPELAVYLPDQVMAQYDTIILGFPIWWHTAPMAVLSFLNYYDVSGKTIYTFCTSGSSAITESTVDVRNNAVGATVVEGRRLTGSNDSNIESWLDGLGLIKTPETPETPEMPETPEQPENPVYPPVDPDDDPPTQEPTEPSGGKILIVYFTAETGNTERLANYIHSQIGGDIVKIDAAQPYTSQDLNYSIPDNRPEVEKAENARPEIARSTYDQIDIGEYDVVFIGYPIWWWTAPMIVGTFLEHYDLTGYDVYPFSQSASMNATQFETSMDFVRECAVGANVHDGLFARATSTTAIDAYLTANGFIGQ